ncbi:MAG: D-alanyl-D-alanine carboxypeptidase [Blautia sp.]|nr:D-alanyl-D-alanine carboxypeptidase [Blautia sp.]
MLSIIICFSLVLSWSAISPAQEASSTETLEGEAAENRTQDEGESEQAESSSQSSAPTESHLPTYQDAPQSNSWENWPEGPLIEGAAAIVMDLDTDAILYAKNIDTPHYPASITKVMTGLLACEYLNPSDSFVMTESAAYGIEPGSSSIYGDTNEKFTVEQGLMALMLESANEMALMLGELVSGSEKKFVELMNLRARQLGCTHTHFNNPNGLPDSTHVTTARDMALIGKAAWNNLTFRRYYTTDYYEIPPTNIMKETRYLLNNHRMMEGRDYYYEGVVGGKTGYTDDAGNTLVTFCQRDGMNLVVVVLSSTIGAFPDTAALLDYAYSNFEHLRLSISQNPTPSLLPSERFILKPAADGGSVFPFRENVVLTIPVGTSRSEISSRQSLESNAAGPFLIRSEFTYHGHPVGYGIQYEKKGIGSILR